MTATAHATPGRTAATSGWLPSVASGVTEVVWPLYLTLVLSLGAWVLVPTVVLGWSSVTITSGSMAPSLQPGHVVVFEPYAGGSLDAGTVVTFRDERLDRLVTHRIAGTFDDGTFRTRGDNNASDDPFPLTEDRIVGVGRLVVPAAGLPALWMHQGRTALLAGFAALTVVAGTSAVRSSASGVRAGAGALRRLTARRRRRGGRHLRRSTARRTTALTAGVLVVVGVLATATVAKSAFAGTNDNSANSFAAGTLADPTGLTATGGCQLIVLGPKVDLSWTAAGDATGYVILRSTTSGSGYQQVGTSSTTSWSDTGVSTGRTYHYLVRSTAQSWTSGPSNEASGTTPSLCL